MLGLAHDEAINLVAHMMGLDITKQTWTLKQLRDMLFLRELNKNLEK
jgi:hypothetical protein